MKLIFISATLAIIWYMRKHRVVSQSYSKEEDTFKIAYLVGPALLLALLVNHELSIMEVQHRGAPASGAAATTDARHVCCRCCGRSPSTLRRWPFCRSWCARCGGWGVPYRCVLNSRINAP